MHDCGIRCNGPPKDIVSVCEVDDDNLILLVHFLPNTDEVVGFQSQGLQSEGRMSYMSAQLAYAYLPGRK